jgi:hypothetical protein
MHGICPTVLWHDVSGSRLLAPAALAGAAFATDQAADRVAQPADGRQLLLTLSARWRDNVVRRPLCGTGNSPALIKSLEAIHDSREVCADRHVAASQFLQGIYPSFSMIDRRLSGVFDGPSRYGALSPETKRSLFSTNADLRHHLPHSCLDKAHEI